MTLTLEVPPELEAALRKAAEREGLDPHTYILNALEARVRQTTAPPAHLKREEAALLQKINQGLPPETWRRYHELLARRRAEVLTPDEQAALIALSDEIEAWNAQRLSLLAELSRVRNVPLKALVEELGLSTPPYA